jgi:hypothetical protein
MPFTFEAFSLPYCGPFHGLIDLRELVPGAHAPGFMPPPASQVPCVVARVVRLLQYAQKLIYVAQTELRASRPAPDKATPAPSSIRA